MNTKDYILIAVSVCALGLSLISIIITLIQKNKETKRTIRKTLTDTLESISKINIEATKLNGSKEIDFSSEPMIQLRRNFNSQRRVLIAHADFLIQRYDKLATEIDCNIVAGAYAAIGDQDKAEYFWQKAIDKSISIPIKHMNLRGFGIFLFHVGKENKGRELFDQALSLSLTENDENKILKIDTYLILSDLEKDYGTKENSELNLVKAIEVCSTIATHRREEEMHNIIRSKLPKA
jgi:tetratricopeptide (TPR) repeat protein